MRTVVTDSGKVMHLPGGIRFAPNSDVHSAVYYSNGALLTKCGRKGYQDKVIVTRDKTTCEPCIDNGG